MKVTADIMFVNNIPFMVSVSRGVNFTTVEYVSLGLKTILYKSMVMKIQLYKNNIYNIKAFLTNRQV